MILYACPDLLFATRIRATAEANAVPSLPAANPDQLAAALNDHDQPEALLIDLDVEQATAMITTAADASLTVIAFGPHVAKDRLAAAQDAGADEALPRSRFTAELESIVRRFR
ncbi:MAG: hypothetical protein R3336_03195 [Phycisphaeraceae bacterium]|nr:hypothetical protein [Phycisphaeraceae bacterium]